MRLRWSPTSPFASKVAVAIREKGIEKLIELEESSPLSREDRAANPNPLGKIPCLITQDGLALYDSPVIIEYLDTTCDGPELLPASGSARWTALRRQALADGVSEAMVACFAESLRKPERQSRGWIAHNRSIAVAGIAALEKENFADTVDVGTIAAAVALSCADRIFPDEDWRSGNAGLAGWFDAFSQRPSMAKTVATSSGT